jgi:hypothetical protein
MMSVDPDITCNEILDYFGFSGDYIGGTSQSSSYKNLITGETGIRYTDEAFYSHDALFSTYMKESFHVRRMRNGRGELGDTEIFEVARWPEERQGTIHQYKNNGLYRSEKNFLQLIENTEIEINTIQGLYNSPYNYVPFESKWWHFVYRTQRKW